MDFLKSLAGIYYLGIGCGVWNKDEVIEWCDRVIEAMDHPPVELLEVSMMSKSKLDDIERKLFELSAIEDEEHMAKVVLSIIHKKAELAQLPAERAIRITSRLLVHTGLSWESEYYGLYSFDDSYDLAVNGVIEKLPAEVEKDFIGELGAFQKYFKEFHELYDNVLKQE
ncbi:hypothetical protein [Domibacillus indicus]|uniref:hypothetical protein n=1 Tax=Domibacillus indicus TaxID=1437523 RepID=UPI000617B6AF|nr:hypothetical protein [Domibacillus indicus]